MKTSTEQTIGKRDLAKEANEVYAKLAENPNIGIELDPELADFMGAFEEDAVTLDDILPDEEKCEE